MCIVYLVKATLLFDAMITMFQKDGKLFMSEKCLRNGRVIIYMRYV